MNLNYDKLNFNCFVMYKRTYPDIYADMSLRFTDD